MANTTAAAVAEVAALVSRSEFDSMKSGINSFFLLTMGLIIFLMQCGFAFLEAGSVRSKNTTNILIKNLLDSCITAFCYWATGWAISYGANDGALSFLSPFFGFSDFFAIGLETSNYASWFFQFTFTATASTIVSGALAERCEFQAYFAYCAALTLFIYPVVTHWCWDSSGWLNAGPGQGIKYTDFAGSGVVHLLGGTCALVGAALLGPRIGRFASKDGSAEPISGHSVPFAALGGFILMFGFFAFNGGSQASITEPGDGDVVATAMVNTMMSGAAAAIVVLVFNKVLGVRKWSLLLTINAVLAGMVAACAGCNVIYPWSAAVTGFVAGCSYMFFAYVCSDIFKIDDPLDAFAVHAGGGIVGLIFAPIFMRDVGVIYNPGLASFGTLGWNVLSALVIIIWSTLTIGPLFLLMKVLKVFRVSEEIEMKGLDIYKHGEPAYPLIAYGHGWLDDILADPALSAQDRRRKVSQNMSLGAPSMMRFENSELHARHVRPANGHTIDKMQTVSDF